MKKLKVRVPLKGISTGASSVQVEAEGFEGAGCQLATKSLIDAIGEQESEELKPEFYSGGDQDTYIAAS